MRVSCKSTDASNTFLEMIMSVLGTVFGIGIICLLSDTGGLGQTAGKPGTRRLVNGTLGQPVTLPGCISGENDSIITWDYRSSPTTGKIQLCTKSQNSPIQYNKQGIRLNLKDCSLEIQNLTEHDQGLYEMNLRTNLTVHEQVTELKIYERVSLPIITISEAFTEGVCNVSLVCSLEHGTEPVYTWWSGDGKVTADGSHILTDEGRRLALSIPLPNNNSVYNCTVRNPVSEETRSMDLTQLCTAHEAVQQQQALHIGLITAAIVVGAIILASVGCMYWKKKPNHDEAPNTERRSEPPLYAVIGRANQAREQPQRHLRELDASGGEQNGNAQLTTIYDEIKFNPNLDTAGARPNEGKALSAHRLSSDT
ncbi:signaling lymphocytic activation molecule-like isoform X3 [Leucoraja erinacea]|uniref:signaling lymphocytic activation molecule-like isoform X3 n=1 Tax=Leucoraja erinaceus TaxID=7782 RepID=UPI0024558BC7|nr:signaling lymphocytic activation molecule-like isoform X3 [Leucoraja erinacea]